MRGHFLCIFRYKIEKTKVDKNKQKEANKP